MRLSTRRTKLLFLAALATAMAAGVAGFVLPVAADSSILGSFSILSPSGSQGSIEVSGTNDARTSITLSETAVDFGHLDPMGYSEPVAEARGLPDPSGDLGSYYAWVGADGLGFTVTVRSNREWTGMLWASENTDTSRTLTVQSGALRIADVEPSRFEDCAGAVPLTTGDAPWASGQPGVTVFSQYLCLRSGWQDEPGTFRSQVIYTVTQ